VAKAHFSPRFDVAAEAATHKHICRIACNIAEFILWGIVFANTKPQKLKNRCENGRIFVGRGFSHDIMQNESGFSR
jgi:hypothetical protein